MDFTRKDTATIMDGLVVRYQRENSEISASRNGVVLYNIPTLRTLSDIDYISKYIRRAYEQYISLRYNGTALTEEEVEAVLK